jgi:hypothetical protein
MPLDRDVESFRHNPATVDGHVDPFAIVAGLIVAILLGSFLLWLNGGEEINGRGYTYGTEALSEVAPDN